MIATVFPPIAKLVPGISSRQVAGESTGKPMKNVDFADATPDPSSSTADASYYITATSGLEELSSGIGFWWILLYVVIGLLLALLIGCCLYYIVPACYRRAKRYCNRKAARKESTNVELVVNAEVVERETIVDVIDLPGSAKVVSQKKSQQWNKKIEDAV